MKKRKIKNIFKTLTNLACRKLTYNIQANIFWFIAGAIFQAILIKILVYIGLINFVVMSYDCR